MSHLVRSLSSRIVGVGFLACAAALALLLCAPLAYAGGYKNVGSVGEAQFTNGILTFLMERNSVSGDSFLEMVDNATGDVIDLYYFPYSEDVSWSVSYAYGNAVFVTRASFKEWRYDTYAYNLKTNTLKRVAKKCAIVATNGSKYVVGGNTYRSDVGPSKYTLYRMNASGKMVKVKVLTKYGLSPKMTSKYIYYASGSKNLSKIGVYRCKATTGKSVKKLGGMWKAKKYSWGDAGMVLTPKVTSKYCLVTFQGGKTGNYKYTYKTKKLKKLSDAKFYKLLGL